VPEKGVDPRIYELIDAFTAAGHQATKNFACDHCGTTLYDFAKKGRLPCLLTPNASAKP
jgi:protein-arginine kinase activator protein McsA